MWGTGGLGLGEAIGECGRRDGGRAQSAEPGSGASAAPGTAGFKQKNFMKKEKPTPQFI